MLLLNLIDIIVAIVAAMQTAPSKAQEALPWHLFLWLPHLILAEKDRNSPEEESAKQIKLKLHLLTNNPQILINNLKNHVTLLPLLKLRPAPQIGTQAFCQDKNKKKSSNISKKETSAKLWKYATTIYYQKLHLTLMMN